MMRKLRFTKREITVWLLGLPLYFSASLLVTQKRRNLLTLQASHSHPARGLIMRESVFHQRAVNGVPCSVLHDCQPMNLKVAMIGVSPLLLLAIIGVGVVLFDKRKAGAR